MHRPAPLVLIAALLAGCGASVLDDEPLEAPDEEVAALEAEIAAADDYTPEIDAGLTGALSVASRAQALACNDRDRDGVCDGLEEWLLRRYRPYYRFSKGGGEERRRPADAVAQLALSRFGTTLGSGDAIGCGRDGDDHLDPPSRAFTCRGFDANLRTNPTLAPWCLDMNNDSYDGDPWDETTRSAPGLYGHVAPDQVFSRRAYKLEYWQYFAHNDQDASVRGVANFNHEGDWCGVQLWLDERTRRPLLAVHLVHGQELFFDLRPFRLRSACEGGTACLQEVPGAHYDPSPGDLHDSADPYQDNAMEVYWDDKGAPHPVVYIERDAHEFWPTPRGGFIGANEHDGQGRSYLPVMGRQVLNMGEVWRPFSLGMLYILRWNGYWGCTRNDNRGLPDATSPPGPAMHCAWRWVDRPEERAINPRAPEQHPRCEDGFDRP